MKERELNPPEYQDYFSMMPKELKSFIGRDFILYCISDTELFYKAVHKSLINMTYAVWVIPHPDCFRRKEIMPQVVNFNELAMLDGAVLQLKNLAGNTVAEWSREHEIISDVSGLNSYDSSIFIDNS